MGGVVCHAPNGGVGGWKILCRISFDKGPGSSDPVGWKR